MSKYYSVVFNVGLHDSIPLKVQRQAEGDVEMFVAATKEAKELDEKLHKTVSVKSITQQGVN